MVDQSHTHESHTFVPSGSDDDHEIDDFSSDIKGLITTR